MMHVKLILLTSHTAYRIVLASRINKPVVATIKQAAVVTRSAQDPRTENHRGQL